MKKGVVWAVAGLLGIVAAVAALLLFPARREATFFAMGGIPFKVVAYDRTPLEFSGDIAAVKERVAELEATFNRYNPESELSRMNGSAAVAPFPMNADMARIMAVSRRWNRETGGAFDPSVGPLIDLWRKAGKDGELPTREALSKARALVDLKRISAVGVNRVFYARPGMNLDFGAIAKGLIDDIVSELLRARGVSRGVVDAGGNVLAFGEGTFDVGLQDPTAPRGTLLGTLTMPAGALISSGKSERFVEIGGKRYSHIIDPRTGEPIENDLLSATVVGGSATDADAIATALIVLGREKAVDFIRKQGGRYEALFVEQSADGPVVWASASLLAHLHLKEPWASRVQTF